MRIPLDATRHLDDEDETIYEDVDTSAASYDYRAQQARPLTEQTMDDFDDFFNRCEGLTFIFLSCGPGQVNTVQPDMFSGIALADAALHDSEYDPPYPNRQRLNSSSRNAVPQSQVLDVVQTRVAEMLRRGSEFVLLWHVTGDNTVHVDSDLGAFADNLVNLLECDLGEYLNS